MRNQKSIACALLLMLALSSCGSLRKPQPVAATCPPPPAPAAWMMEPSNSMQRLDKLISISE